MALPAIEVEGVGKRYWLGPGHGQPGNLADRIDSAIRAPLRLLSRRNGVSAEPPSEEFWALRDISFSVERGEVFGLIGANGAGKSTMLKLLSLITAPTEGRVTLRGTAGTLLEVGTGFDPELTGRENIYLNGAILGMRIKETREHYDEIVEFAGLEQFIDTPVKRYSSGMLVRLGFAVAAHLDPEILIVDEVLAVGDAEFQQKCMGKMKDVADAGRTIVLVSHGMGMVRAMCDRAALLERGRMTECGPAEKVTADYLERFAPVQHGGVSTVAVGGPRAGSGEARVTRVALLDDRDEPVEEVLFGAPLTVEIDVEVTRRVPSAVFMIGLNKPGGGRILTTHSSDHGDLPAVLEPGRFTARARLDVTLLPGEFVVDIGVMTSTGQTIDHVGQLLSFTALGTAPVGGDHYRWEPVEGIVRPATEWTLEEQAVKAAPGAVDGARV